MSRQVPQTHVLSKSVLAPPDLVAFGCGFLMSQVTIYHLPAFLYIWSDHYTRKDAGWKLFDHKKDIVVIDSFPVVAGCFCWPFSFFVIFFIACNFCKLFFTVESSLFVCYFFTAYNFHKLLFHYWEGPGELFTYIYSLFRGRGCALIFYFYFFTVEGERGGGWWFFFCFHLKCGRRTGKLSIFFLKFFSLWSG
jgi:hypothetical protein